MSLPVVQSDLENRISVAEVARFSGGVQAKIDEAIAEAWGKARSAALNVFSPTSFDALTSSTLPAEAKSHIVSDALDILSSGKNRADDITKKADEARSWRSWVATDKVRCFDGILSRPSIVNGVKASTAAPSQSVFNRDNTNSKFGSIDPEF
jgi:hypothetical protein